MTPQPPYPPSDHYDGALFHNPGVNTDKTFADLVRWRRTSRRAIWPERRLNRAYPPPPERVGESEIAVTFIGQASFLITTARCTILTDPFFSDRASPVAWLGPRRVRPPGLAIRDLPPLHAILVSHNHYDHMDLPSLRALRLRPTRDGKPVPIVTGLGNTRYFAQKRMPGAVELDWWEDVRLGPGLKITFVPAQHWSSRSLRDRRRTLWGGFFIENGPQKIYFAGDSGACSWFRTIGERLGAPDLALLPIGAYEPRWFMAGQHMDPAEAVQAHLDLGANRSIGMHFGTIQLTEEPIDEPLHALARARRDAGVADEAFTTLDVGETRVIGP